MIYSLLSLFMISASFSSKKLGQWRTFSKFSDDLPKREKDKQ